MFLCRWVVTAEAPRRVAQGKELGIDDVKPVSLDALRLDKVKGAKPPDAEVAPMLEWIQSKLEDDPLKKTQGATEKEWTTIVTPADDFDFVGDKNELCSLCGPLQTKGGHCQPRCPVTSGHVPMHRHVPAWRRSPAKTKKRAA
jgi:hypothetical protein